MINSSIHSIHFRYPYVACEIICADNGKFVEAMRRNTNILTPLWSFLIELKRPAQDAPINTSVTDGSPSAIQNAAIFFSRLNIYLLGKMQSTMLLYLQERVPNAMYLLVKNLDLQPITELLYRFYALPAINYSTPSNVVASSSSRSSTPVQGVDFDVFTWLQEAKLYQYLAAQFRPSATQEDHQSAAQFIIGLFNLPYPESSSKTPLLEPFIAPSWLHSLLRAIFDDSADGHGPIEPENEESALIAGLQVLTAIFKAIRQFKAQHAATPFVRAFLETAETIFDLLNPTTKSVKMANLPCGRVQVLGRVRLAAVEMLIECVALVAEEDVGTNTGTDTDSGTNTDAESSCLDDSVHASVIELFKTHRFTAWMLEAVFSQFPHNSFLHAAFVRYIKLLCSNPALVQELLRPVEDDLKHAIIRAQRDNDACLAQPRQNRLPFMGHLIAVAETLCALDERRSASEKTAAFTVRDASWHEFATKSLKEALNRKTRVLGGIRPPLAPADLSSSDEGGEHGGSGSFDAIGGNQDGFLDYNAVFGSGDEEQLARYFVQQIIGNAPHQFLYDEYHRRFSGGADSSDGDDDSDDAAAAATDDDDDEMGRRRGIEIPLLLGHGDFDEMMFEASFADSGDESAFDSDADSSESDGMFTSSDSDGDSDTDEDFVMHE